MPLDFPWKKAGFGILKKNRHVAYALLLSLLFLFLGLMALPNYGATWDEPHHLDTYYSHLEFFSTGEYNFEFEHQKYFGFLPYSISGTTHYIFHEATGILSFWDAYHLGHLFVFCLSIFILYLLAFRLEKSNSFAIIVALIFAFLPRIFANGFNTPKDFEPLFFSLLAAYYAISAYQDKDWKFYLVPVFLALAVSAKLSALSVAFAIMIWAFLIGPARDIFSARIAGIRRPAMPNLFGKKALDSLKKILISSVLFLIVYFFSNPFYLLNPIESQIGLVNFYMTANHDIKERYLGEITNAREMPWHYLPVMVGITTPELTLICFLLGIFFVSRELNNRGWLLIAIILMGITAMTMFSGAMNGVRQFLLFYPYFALVAGFGLYQTKKIVNDEKIFFILCFFVIWVQALTVISYHPYQRFYFNNIVGGPQGAIENFRVFYWEEYLKEAGEHINEYAKPGEAICSTQGGFLMKHYLKPGLVLKEQCDLPIDWIVIVGVPISNDTHYSVEIKNVYVAFVYKLNITYSNSSGEYGKYSSYDSPPSARGNFSIAKNNSSIQE